MIRALAPLTVPMSWLYRAVVAQRNARYDRGAGVERLDRPVISVGNITVGGTGKTPMVMWIAEELLAAGHRPVIAMRGYRSKHGEPGDEELEYRGRFADRVPVVADPDRAQALRAFFADPSQAHFDSVVLDDGFQHRQLHRDLDLVLVDATQDTLRSRLLPAGRLREPIQNLLRANGVIVTRATRPESALAQSIREAHRQPPIAWSRHGWAGLELHASQTTREDVSWLRGRKVITMFGIGHPEALRQAVTQAGAICVADIPVRDHQNYGPALLKRARRSAAGADAIVVSGKDWVKLRTLTPTGLWPVPIVVPQLRIDLFEGADTLRDMLRAAAGGKNPPSLPTTLPALK